MIPFVTARHIHFNTHMHMHVRLVLQEISHWFTIWEDQGDLFLWLKETHSSAEHCCWQTKPHWPYCHTERVPPCAGKFALFLRYAQLPAGSWCLQQVTPPFHATVTRRAGRLQTLCPPHMPGCGSWQCWSDPELLKTFPRQRCCY